MLKTYECDRLSWPEVFDIFANEDPAIGSPSTLFLKSFPWIVDSKQKKQSSFVLEFLDVLSKAIKRTFNENVNITLFKLKLQVSNLSSYLLQRNMLEVEEYDDIRNDLFKNMDYVKKVYQVLYKRSSVLDLNEYLKLDPEQPLKNCEEEVLKLYHQAVGDLVSLVKNQKEELDEYIRYLLCFILEFNKYPKISDDPLKEVETFSSCTITSDTILNKF
jgi:hypothetical protein